MESKCLVCNNTFKFKPDKIHKGKYCSRKCFYLGRWGGIRKKIKECPQCKKKFTTYNKICCSKNCADLYKIGKSLINRKRRMSKKCEWCKKIFDRAISNFHSKHYFCCNKCSSDWWAKYGLHGKNHAKWNGGEYNPYYDGWKCVRKIVLKKYKNRCVRCEKNGRIEIHHMKPLRLFKNKKMANDIKNLIALCPKCHASVEKNIVK